MSSTGSEVRTAGVSAVGRGRDGLVPLSDAGSCALLACEALRAAAQANEAPLVLLDRETALHPDLAELARSVGKQVLVFGGLPAGRMPTTNLSAAEPVPSVLGHEHFVVAMSPAIGFALLFRPTPASETAPFGVWSVNRSEAARVAEQLLGTRGVPEGVTLPGPASPALEVATAYGARLMAYYADLHESARHGSSINKDDLFSVLDILKAISAKRRAHDILFVFVEQIAKLIKVDRCSIVRIWGGEQRGHVLASHEDERVNDLVITLDKYPEIRLAMETRERIVIGDVARDPITRQYGAELEAAGIRSISVIPIALFDPNVGSLLLRVARHRTSFTPREISFCEIVAEAASNALERAHLFEQIQHTNERLEFLAVTDGLTGLYNHRYFRKRLQEEFDRAVRYGLSLSCLIFDVDNFKRINDTYGHLQGDSILREMAMRIVRTVRKSDIVARYGGEEFTVVMPQTGIDGAKVEAERLHKELSGEPYQGMPPDQGVTVSIGVSTLLRESMLDSDALLRAADSALYEAKRQGKNRVVTGPVEGDPS